MTQEADKKCCDTTDKKDCGDKMDGKNCKCPCHKMPGLIIIVVGLAFLLETLNVLDTRTAHIIMAAGVMLYGFKTCGGKGMCKCCSNG